MIDPADEPYGYGYMVQINDPEELCITFTVPGTKYNPDQIEDIKRRLMDAYREALAARVTILGRSADELVELDDEEDTDGAACDEPAADA